MLSVTEFCDKLTHLHQLHKTHDLQHICNYMSYMYEFLLYILVAKRHLQHYITVYVNPYIFNVKIVTIGSHIITQMCYKCNIVLKIGLYAM